MSVETLVRSAEAEPVAVIVSVSPDIAVCIPEPAATFNVSPGETVVVVELLSAILKPLPAAIVIVFVAPEPVAVTPEPTKFSGS